MEHKMSKCASSWCKKEAELGAYCYKCDELMQEIGEPGFVDDYIEATHER
jgi:hypothetical protein